MRVAGLIAAAGKGQRAGGAKAVRIAGDDPRMFLDRSVSAMRSWGCCPVVAVVQEEHKAVARSFGAVAVVPTPLPEAMIDSLRAGIKYLERLSDVEAVLWSPVDCPSPSRSLLVGLLPQRRWIAASQSLLAFKVKPAIPSFYCVHCGGG